MTETTKQTNIDWLENEKAQLPTRGDFESKPSLKLEANKITTFTVDFSLPFDKWTNAAQDVTKKIIPVVHEGVSKNLWLNVKNPLYGDIIVRGVIGQTQFKVFTTGTQKDTRYALVE